MIDSERDSTGKQSAGPNDSASAAENVVIESSATATDSSAQATQSSASDSIIPESKSPEFSTSESSTSESFATESGASESSTLKSDKPESITSKSSGSPDSEGGGDGLSAKAPPLWQIIFAFAVLYIVWGSTYIAIKFAIHTIPPFMMGGIRFLIAGAIVFIVGLCLGHKPPQLLHWRSAAIVGCLLLALGNGGVLIATHHIPSGVVSLMVAMTPVYMSLFADLGKKLPNRATIIGLILGTLGVACLIGPDGFKGNINWVGLVAVSVASLSWSAGSIYSRYAPLSPSTVMSIAAQMLCGGLAMAIISICIGEHEQFDPALISAKSLWSTVYLILFGSLGGYSAYFWLLKKVSPSKVSTYAYVNPVVAVFLGWLLAGEPVTPNIFIAGSIIIAAVWFITKSGKK